MLIGFAPVLLLFLYFVGVNIVPVVLAGAFLGILLFAVRSRGQLSAIGSGRQAGRKKPQMLSFDEIGGQERAKQELTEALEFLIRPDEIARLRQLLLTGPPGTGKTLLAKAAAHHTDSVFVAASGSEFVEMYVGVGASRIRELFREARQKAQKTGKNSAVIFIDEIDVIGGKRDGGQHREYDQTLNQLLTEMDGIQTNESPASCSSRRRTARTRSTARCCARDGSTGTSRSICRTRRDAGTSCRSTPPASRSARRPTWTRSPRRRSASRAPSSKAS